MRLYLTGAFVQIILLSFFLSFFHSSRYWTGFFEHTCPAMIVACSLNGAWAASRVAVHKGTGLICLVGDALDMLALTKVLGQLNTKVLSAVHILQSFSV